MKGLNMKIIKKKLNKKYIDSNGTERESFGYFIVTDNNHYIMIKPVFTNDYTKLDMVSEFVRTNKK